MWAKVVIFGSTFLALVVAGYWIFKDPSLDRQETPIAQKKDKASSLKTEDLAQTETAVLDNLVKRRAAPIDIKQANDFVAQDQPVSFTVEPNVQANAPTKRTEDLKFESDNPVALGEANKRPKSLVTELPVYDSGFGRTQSSPSRDEERKNKATLHAIARQHPMGLSEGAQLKDSTAQLEAAIPQELDKDSTLVDQKAQLTKRSYPLAVQSIGELLKQHGKTVETDDLFYLHTVHENDKQGIWGIIQSGITQSFSRGVKVTMAADIGILRVSIPDDADELLTDKTSSFLGKMIYDKSMQSIVYNIKDNRMGQNPNLLRPGQEIVIVTFRPSELISIFRYFNRNRG